MRTIARTTIVAALLAAGAARAEDACRADAERLCAGIPGGGGRIAACLKANRAQISPECEAQLASVGAKVKEVGEACAADVENLCPDVRPGQGNVVRCLSANAFSLTAECRQVVRGAQEKAAEFQKACKKDAAALCKGIRPGEGRILACLESRKAELSPPCAKVMGHVPPPAAVPAAQVPAQGK